MYIYIYISWGTYFVLTCKNTPYNTKSVTNSHLTDSEEIKGPQSLFECVMRCQRKTKEGFFTNDNKCFFHNGVFEHQGNTNGISTEKLHLNKRGSSGTSGE